MKYLFLITWCITISYNCTESLDLVNCKVISPRMQNALYCPITGTCCSNQRIFFNKKEAYDFYKVIKPNSVSTKIDSIELNWIKPE